MKKISLLLVIFVAACQTTDSFAPLRKNHTPLAEAKAICDNTALAEASKQNSSLQRAKTERYTRRACMAEHGWGKAN